MSGDHDTSTIEEGDIFFFYRPKVGKETAESLDETQRFYVVTAPEQRNGKFRLFMMGRKKMPEQIEDESAAERRHWALNVLTTADAQVIRHELLPVEYETETRGKRRVSAAVPAGEGKYQIVSHDNHTELAYVLELPEKPGTAQEEFEMMKEASYIISVKNPDIQVPGYKAFEKRKPNYPQYLKDKFADRRWINVEDSSLLDYENCQLLLINTNKKDVEEELGIDLNAEKERLNTAELFKLLKIKREEVPLAPLLKGEFPSESEQRRQPAAKKLSRREAPGRRGGKAGGRKAATSAPSASAISRILAGIDFPKKKNELVNYAEEHTEQVEAAQQVIQVIRDLPDRTYNSMAEVQKGLSQVR